MQTLSTHAVAAMRRRSGAPRIRNMAEIIRRTSERLERTKEKLRANLQNGMYIREDMARFMAERPHLIEQATPNALA